VDGLTLSQLIEGSPPAGAAFPRDELMRAVVSSELEAGRLIERDGATRVLDKTGNLKAVQKLLAMRRSRPRPTFTPIGISSSWPRRCVTSWRRTSCESFPTPMNESPAKRGFHGGGGNRTRVRSRTGLNVYRYSSPLRSRPAGRWVSDLPPGQPSCGLTPPAIGAPSGPARS
jgi:hypothetical protein